VRFNPLKYEDESGHCATLANGEADWENDAACWQLAYAIYGYGLGDGPLARRFAADWKVSPQAWLVNVASQHFADADYLRPFAEQYHNEWASRAGLPVHPVQWHPPPDYRSLNEPEIIGFLLGERTVCETWDCTAIGLDITSIGVQIARDAGYLSTPLTGPFGVFGGTTGAASQNALEISSVGWVVYQSQSGNASGVDLAVTGFTSVLGYVPVVGEGAAIFQLIWDILDPLHPW
jgi:hypothetical protein